jgi:aminoglycoside 6'-N-acetyltransferase
MSADLSFRPLEILDLPMLSDWLRSDAVARWYQDPDYIEELEDQMTDVRIRQWIVSLGDEPIAYVQDYQIHGWKKHPLSFLPSGSRGLDTFIGKPERLGLGYGSAYLRKLAERLKNEGVPALGIDPHPDNAAAIRAYEKIGFVQNEVRQTKWGRALLMSMRF